MVIFCGHFPDGAEKFTREEFESETQAEWYLRQMLGSANFHAGPLMAFMSGNLCYQIEHHLFPDFCGFAGGGVPLAALLAALAGLTGSVFCLHRLARDATHGDDSTGLAGPA